jgi:hypothetical protein
LRGCFAAAQTLALKGVQGPWPLPESVRGRASHKLYTLNRKML